jgi:type VI secretion system secreted protein Hcp
MLVEAFSHEVTLPRDPQSGQPSGQRVHGPVTITGVYDKATPLLYAALTSGERLPKITVKWFRTSATGTQEHYFTHEFEDAILVNIRSHMPNCQDPAMASFTHLNDISFTYRKVTWTHEVSVTSGSDDWRTPVSA